MGIIVKKVKILKWTKYYESQEIIKIFQTGAEFTRAMGPR